MSVHSSALFFESTIALLISVELHQFLEDGHFGGLLGELKTSRPLTKIIQGQRRLSLFSSFDALKDLQAGLIDASFLLSARDSFLVLVDLLLPLDGQQEIVHVLVLYFEG